MEAGPRAQPFATPGVCTAPAVVSGEPLPIGEYLEFLLVGLNYRTAPLEVREQLSLTKAQLPQALETMADYGVPGVVVSTCNRSEFLRHGACGWE